MAMDDQQVVAALRAGDERAFLLLVERHHPVMVRLAQSFVSSKAVAEEVAQEAWLAVEQWSSPEVCDALGISEGNQRVLLHRARSKVRAALERRLSADCG